VTLYFVPAVPDETKTEENNWQGLVGRFLWYRPGLCQCRTGYTGIGFKSPKLYRPELRQYRSNPAAQLLPISAGNCPWDAGGGASRRWQRYSVIQVGEVCVNSLNPGP
jgi:hypothetical protein